MSEENKAPAPSPIVGTPVQYFNKKMVPPGPYAAMVTKLHYQDCVNLVVFDNDGQASKHPDRFSILPESSGSDSWWRWPQ